MPLRLSAASRHQVAELLLAMGCILRSAQYQARLIVLAGAAAVCAEGVLAAVCDVQEAVLVLVVLVDVRHQRRCK